MASFDVENLYSNVPLNDTINIILDQLFIRPNSAVNGINEAFFQKSFGTFSTKFFLYFQQ